MPVFFIFLSVLGGVNAFGPAGILYGPLILSFATAMIRIYGQEYAHVLSSEERKRSRECAPSTAKAGQELPQDDKNGG